MGDAGFSLNPVALLANGIISRCHLTAALSTNSTRSVLQHAQLFPYFGEGFDCLVKVMLFMSG